jgi:hypothetical protein
MADDRKRDSDNGWHSKLWFLSALATRLKEKALRKLLMLNKSDDYQ